MGDCHQRPCQLALACAGASAQNSNQGVSKNEIVIGSIQDLSGPIAGFGKQVRLGMMLRVDEVNEQGGINGRKLVLKVEDSAYDPKKAVLAAQKLVNQDKIFVMAGTIGTVAVARSTPDGYTILSNTLPFVANPALHSKPPYDVIKEFEPVMLMANQGSMIALHPSVPVKNFVEFIAYAKANPAKINFASAAVASPGHLAGEMLNLAAGIHMQHVPYKGSGQAVVDLNPLKLPPGDHWLAFYGGAVVKYRQPKKDSTAAPPTDIVDIVVTEPILIRVKPGAKQ